MSERLPPTVAIFLSETIRRRIMPRLGNRVAGLRYDTAHSIKTAFVEELNQAMAKAAERLNPDVAPALSIAIVADPAQPALDPTLVDLIKRACPPNVAFTPQWISLHGPPTTPQAGVAFLLSTTWRGGLIQGGSLDRAYQALILSVLATENSRVAAVDFDCFTRLRFHSAGKLFKVAIDTIEVPNFDQLAELQLRQATLASYFPEIDSRARNAALRVASTGLHNQGSRAAIEPTILEPLLCAAIAQSLHLTQAAALLGDWATGATGATADILRDLQIALIHWTASQTVAPSDLRLADTLFKTQGFPLLHEIRPSARSQTAFRNQAARLTTELIKENRAELDTRYYELLPSHCNAAQRLAIAAGLSNTNGSAAKLTVTRHFPLGLIEDTREEILDLRDLATVLYAMELRSE